MSDTKYFIPKTVEVSKEEYEAYTFNIKNIPPMPSLWESFISHPLILAADEVARRK